MKKFTQITLFLMITLSSMSCSSQENKKTTTQSTNTGDIEVYYFHFTSRCVTCRTVESEAKADVEALYGGKISFQAINLDEESSKAIAEKLQVSVQTLLIVKGSQKIDITNEGFMYARSNPAKLKSIIQDKIDGLSKL
jgi:hypothetical protein